jgi:DNA topoisomerase I
MDFATMKKSGTTGKSLVIVESPAKAKTINKYLGSSFEVHASMGHVRDLPASGLNVDIEKDFEPTYQITPGRKKTVTILKAAAKKCDRLFLATDLDREGEAIAWHLSQLLGIPEERTFRVIFNAITESAIKKAFAEPGKLNMDKVLAQQARRILDRLVGYQISPLLWKKVARGLSAGRVQSVAVKMVVERERQIRNFVPVEYWLIPAIFSTDLKKNYTKQWQDFSAPKADGQTPTLEQQGQWLAEHNAFKAELNKVGDEKFQSANKEKAEKIFASLKGASFKISGIQNKELSSRPSPPFITSTLQQAAANRLGFSAQRTMRIAQQLYEGIDVGSMGSLGLITYMRTDSTHLSGEAVTDARNFISRQFGSDYLPEKPLVYASQKMAQQAHEAIHTTDPDLTPDQLKEFLTDEQYKLYDLIWRRFVACQMVPARWNLTSLDIAAATTSGDCFYRTTGRRLVFDGFTKVWPVGSAEQQFPDVIIGQPLDVVDLKNEQHFTKPPARYNEASLIKALEKEGIGRPSTYASIVSTIQERGYVELNKKQFFATSLGELVTDKLNLYFPKIMDLAFTRYMEERLDKIEEQHLDWVSVLKEFYGPFKKSLDTATEQMKHAKAETTPSEYTCPKCEKPLVYRFGKRGRFLSCSGYPDCKFACPCDQNGIKIEEKVTEHKCPNCGKPMIEKTGRFGKFLGCSAYPDCKTIIKIDKEGNVLAAQKPKEPPKPTGLKCYKCKNGQFVIRLGKKGPFLACDKFPKCRTIIDVSKLEELKKLQEQGNWPPKSEEQTTAIFGTDLHKKKKKTTKKQPV